MAATRDLERLGALLDRLDERLDEACRVPGCVHLGSTDDERGEPVELGLAA